jgi:predicted exporter
MQVILFDYTMRTAWILRFAAPVIIVAGAFLWVLYLGIIKKDWRKGVDIIMPAIFFGVVWALIYHFIFT